MCHKGLELSDEILAGHFHAPCFNEVLELAANCQLGLVAGVESFAISAITAVASWFAEEYSRYVFFTDFCDADQCCFAQGVVFHTVVHIRGCANGINQVSCDLFEYGYLALHRGLVVLPFSYLHHAGQLNHLYGTGVTTCAQTGVQGHHIGAATLGFLVPAHLSLALNGLDTCHFHQVYGADQGLIKDNEFAFHFATESFFAQLAALLVGPDFVALGMFLPTAAIRAESVGTHWSFVAIVVDALVGTFPQKSKLILVRVRS